VQIELSHQLRPPAGTARFRRNRRASFWLNVGSRIAQREDAVAARFVLHTQRMQIAAGLTFKSRRDRLLFS
jgi:hypothetical protein